MTAAVELATRYTTADIRVEIGSYECDSGMSQ